MEIAISPKFTSVDLVGATLDKKIEIFEDQTHGWLLDHARVLASSAGPEGPRAGFAILTLLLVYVESIACFIKGQTSDGKSGKFFAFGMEQIFPGFVTKTPPGFPKDFYSQVRCGQLHQALVRGKVSIGRNQQAAVVGENLDVDGIPSAIRVDPWIFLNHVQTDFIGYLATLRDTTRAVERGNFEKWFDARPS